MLNGSQAVTGRGSLLALNPHVGRGIQWPLLAYIDTQVTVISGCSSLFGSMGPRAHTKYLSQAVGGIVHAQGVRNGLWRGSFLKKNPHVCGGFSGGLVSLQCHPNDCNFMLNGSYGSIRPRGRVRHIEFVIRGVPSAQWVQNSRWMESFLA